MRYNSNKSNRPTVGNELPYSGQPGNPKINKQLKQLEEDINNVAGRLNGYVGEDDSEINGMIGDALDGIRDDVDGLETVTANLIPRLDDLENAVDGFATHFQTADLQAQNAAFHKVVAGKYLFQNGYSITGTSICKINNGSVVYATDGTNSVLVDYTDKDAWVAKAKVEDGEHFSIYSNGVLTFTQSGGWSVYVIGNDFDTDTSIPEETPVNIETGVTIGGTLYAALARDYTFDSIEVTSATINSATVNVLNATSASIDAITTGNVIAEDAVITDADIESLNNSKRNFKGYVLVDTHHGADNIYIKLNKFTGTYYLKLVNGSETMFTATVIWNGTNPVVNYYENTSISDRDCLYKIILTDVGLYFVTNSSGNLYYGWDSFDAVTPESSYYIDEDETEICDYLVRYASRTVFLGNHSIASGMDVLGEVRADYISQTEDKPGFDYRGDATLSTLPLMEEVGPGAVYNITEGGYTDARFVEGAGKPINAGDDVICVSVPEVPTTVHSTEMPTNTRGALVLDDKILIAGGNSIYSYVNGVVTTIATFSGEGEYVVFGKIKKIDNRIFALNTEYVQPYAYSDDNGETWQLYTDVYYDYVNLLGIYKVGNRTFMYSYSEDSYYSDNNGDTWSGLTTYVDGEMESIYNPIIQLPDGSLISFSTRYSDKHLIRYRSEDGINWVTTDTGFDLSEGYLDNNSMSYTTSGIFIEVNLHGEYYLLKSTDNGLTFNRIESEGYPTRQGGFLPLVETSNGILYSYKYSMVSSDAGLSWEEVPLLLDDIEIEGSGGHITSPRYSFFYDVYPAVSGTFIIVPGIISEEARQVLGSTGEYVSKVNLFIAGSLKWNKFAAGVNYDNFVATNITARTALKSKGTLEVDGTSQFDNNVTVNADVTHTGNYTQTGNQTITGNLNRTGNESVDGNATISGLVIIGDLD